MRFTKMHGLGNDYVYVDRWDETLPTGAGALADLARTLSDRHTGIGSDGLITIGPSTVAEVRMEMWNADGSPSEMCGNGLRCAAKLAWDHGRLAGNRSPRFETGAGILAVTLTFAGDVCSGASVHMGAPRLTPDAVPVQHPGPGPLLELRLELDGERLRGLAVGMGNPHCVCFIDDPDHYPVTRLGPLCERLPLFPNRTNVEFVSVLPAEAGLPVLRQRTWERGSGETLACGTGACAALVAAVLDRRIPGREAIIRLNGGDLHVHWLDDAAEVVQTGPAVTVFTGDV